MHENRTEHATAFFDTVWEAPRPESTGGFFFFFFFFFFGGTSTPETVELVAWIVFRSYFNFLPLTIHEIHGRFWLLQPLTHHMPPSWLISQSDTPSDTVVVRTFAVTTNVCHWQNRGKPKPSSLNIRRSVVNQQQPKLRIQSNLDTRAVCGPNVLGSEIRDQMSVHLKTQFFGGPWTEGGHALMNFKNNYSHISAGSYRTTPEWLISLCFSGSLKTVLQIQRSGAKHCVKSMFCWLRKNTRRSNDLDMFAMCWACFFHALR